jgi:hypothetical protein
MAPNHAPLPVSRSSYSFPFTVTGIDFTGAFTLRGPKEGPKVERPVFILLFTCASTRAIHLEVVEDMTTLSFQKPFSVSALITCVHKIFRHPITTRQLSDQQIEWRFIPKRAPW